MVITAYDRAAPKGVGNVKAAGNYAADLEPATRAKEAGYTIALYLDPGKKGLRSRRPAYIAPSP